MHLTIRYLILIALIFLPTIMIFGQRDSLRGSLLRDVLGKSEIRQTAIEEKVKVIAASRSLQTVEDLPFRIHIITREEIMLNGYKTLVDALKSAPGIKISQPGSAELGETFLMRGLIGNEYCKILLNGQPLQPSTLGGLPIGAQLPIRQAERIEIIYGPSAAIYGADATVGVVNIITKESNLSSYAQGDIELGLRGYRYLNFTVGGKLGKNKNILNYSFYGNRRELRDLNLLFKNRQYYNPLQYLADISDTNINDINIIDTAGFMAKNYQPNYEGTLTWPSIRELPQEGRMVGINLSFKGLKFEFENMYRRDHSSIGRTPYLFSYAEPISFLGENLQRIALSYANETDKLASTTQVSYLRYRLDHNSSYSITYPGGNQQGLAFVYTASDDILAEQLLNFKVGDQVSILSGISFQYSGNLPTSNDLPQRFDPSDYSTFAKKPLEPDPVFGDFGQNPITYYNAAAFSQVQFSWKSLKAVGSLRYDYNSRYKSTLNPRLAVLWGNKDSDRYYANYGRAFRAPAPNTAFRSVAFQTSTQGLSYQVIPQPNLQPEVFHAFEIGTRQKISNKVEMNVSFFRNIIRNLISSTFVQLDSELYPLAINTIARTNINSSEAKAKLRGFQLSLIGKDIIQAIKLNSAYHFTRSRGEEVLPKIDDQQLEFEKLKALRMTPRSIHQWQLSFYPTKYLYISLRQQWISSWLRRYTPSVEDSQKELYTNKRYYTMDILTSYQLGNQIRVYVDIKNVFNAEHSGIGATGLDVDAFYNPQQRRFLLLGLSFDMN